MIRSIMSPFALFGAHLKINTFCRKSGLSNLAVLWYNHIMNYGGIAIRPEYQQK